LAARGVSTYYASKKSRLLDAVILKEREKEEKEPVITEYVRTVEPSEEEMMLTSLMGVESAEKGEFVRNAVGGRRREIAGALTAEESKLPSADAEEPEWKAFMRGARRKAILKRRMSERLRRGVA
jgi:hypothetical protein